jgi:hypothetical protein
MGGGGGTAEATTAATAAGTGKDTMRPSVVLETTMAPQLRETVKLAGCLRGAHITPPDGWGWRCVYMCVYVCVYVCVCVCV